MSGRRTPAFTLLELLVALGLLLLLTAVMLGAGTAITRSWSKLSHEQEHLAGLLALERTFDGVLSNAIPFTWPEDSHARAARKELPAFRGLPDRLCLAYMHEINPHNLADGAIRFIDIQVIDGDLIAYYRNRPVTDFKNPPGERQASVLARDVRGFYCRYYGNRSPQDKTLEWLDEWKEDRLDLPLAIMVTVEYEDYGSETWLRRTPGAGWHERPATLPAQPSMPR